MEHKERKKRENTERKDAREKIMEHQERKDPGSTRVRSVKELTEELLAMGRTRE